MMTNSMANPPAEALEPVVRDGAETTFSPPPWVASKGRGDYDPDGWTVVVDGPVRYLIATVENGQPGDCVETEGHTARLIAAAPDLLAALERVLTTHEPSCGTFGTGRYGFPANGDTAAIIESAIAKAHGEAK